jgi:oxygen-dependent protoporphyrinogen oxidase
MEREHGSVIRGMLARAKSKPAPATNGSSPADGKGVSGARYGLFVSFRLGMQTLIDALEQRLGERVRLNSKVKALERTSSGWKLTLGDGSTAEAGAIIIALPAYRAAALLESIDPETANLLNGIPYAGAGTMTLCYRREDIPHPLDGFGFVVPQVEGLTLLGCTFSQQKWPDRAPEGFALLRGFLGDSVLGGKSEPELIALVREDFRKLVGVTAEPQFVQYWQAERCMPHYLVGHLDRVAAIEERMAQIPGLELAGNAFRGVGIPDSVHSGEGAAERVHAGA